MVHELNVWDEGVSWKLENEIVLEVLIIESDFTASSLMGMPSKVN